MDDLFARTVSQTIQASLPVAVAFTFFRRAGRTHAATAIGWGTFAAVLLTFAFAYLFQQSARQAMWDAGFATAAVGVSMAFARLVWRPVATESPMGAGRRRNWIRGAGVAAAA